MIDYQKTCTIGGNPDAEYNFRLNSVDNPVVLPVNVPIKLLITSNDVLHSFSIPALAIKIDAIPGRISELTFIIERPGVF
jgi:cytochrome c oxidase subunit 2